MVSRLTLNSAAKSSSSFSLTFSARILTLFLHSFVLIVVADRFNNITRTILHTLPHPATSQSSQKYTPKNRDTRQTAASFPGFTKSLLLCCDLQGNVPLNPRLGRVQRQQAGGSLYPGTAILGPGTPGNPLTFVIRNFNSAIRRPTRFCSTSTQ